MDNEKIDFHNLKKYSYHLISIYDINNSPRTSDASCFLIIKNKELYLVTALHVFSGWNPLNGEYIETPDLILLILNNKKTNKKEFEKITIPKFFNNEVNKKINEKPDLFFYKLNNNLLQTFEINTLNDFLIENKNNEKKLYVYGFKSPKQRDKVINLQDQINYESELDHISIINEEFDNFNYKSKSELNVIKPGYSGAPLFSFDNNQ